MKEIIKKEENQQINSVDNFISEAIKNNAPVETMERLFALHKEVKAEKAREEFVKAMSEFQSKCPIIKKNKDVKNKDGQSVRYSYASLDSIVSQTKELLASCGLSYTITTKNETGFITTVCKITHIAGHSQESDFKIPIDTEGFMSQPQKYASAQTFAKRYAFCNALGILTGDDDFDAVDVDRKPDLDQIKSIKGKITFLLKELDVKVDDKKEVVKAIKELTQLDVSDDMNNLKEIKNRLEILVSESKNQDENA